MACLDRCWPNRPLGYPEHCSITLWDVRDCHSTGHYSLGLRNSTSATDYSSILQGQSLRVINVRDVGDSHSTCHYSSRWGGLVGCSLHFEVWPTPTLRVICWPPKLGHHGKPPAALSCTAKGSRDGGDTARQFGPSHHQFANPERGGQGSFYDRGQRSTKRKKSHQGEYRRLSEPQTDSRPAAASNSELSDHGTSSRVLLVPINNFLPTQGLSKK